MADWRDNVSGHTYHVGREYSLHPWTAVADRLLVPLLAHEEACARRDPRVTAILSELAAFYEDFLTGTPPGSGPSPTGSRRTASTTKGRSPNGPAPGLPDHGDLPVPESGQMLHAECPSRREVQVDEAVRRSHPVRIDRTVQY